MLGRPKDAMCSWVTEQTAQRVLDDGPVKLVPFKSIYLIVRLPRLFSDEFIDIGTLPHTSYIGEVDYLRSWLR